MHVKIRSATVSDIDNVITFIKEYWNDRHIFVQHREIFLYEQLIQADFRFVLAEDEDTKKIYGICGYIASNSLENPDVSTVVWKTIKSGNAMLGIDILQYLKQSSKSRILSSCGINQNTREIYSYFGYFTGKLNHYYRLADKPAYRIAKIAKKTILPIASVPNKLVIMRDFQEFTDRFAMELHKERKPYKDLWYIQHRYYQHPVYQYLVFGIDKGTEKFESVIVAREIKQNSAKILRIVDFIGFDNDLLLIAQSLQQLMDRNDYEYIDFYSYGLSQMIMLQMGFTLKDENDPNIIPNYFEPFEQRNVDIYFFTSDPKDFYLFKADGDQDRPNVI